MIMRSPTVIILAIVFLLSVKPHEATRILDEEEQLWMKKDQNLLLPSLQRRPVRPPAPNGCTWIPGGGGRPCTASISGRNFAGRKVPPPPPQASDAYPKQMFEFGVATDSK
ncbi:hypothetical protein Salat_0495500 [Sesamum alatum]|uniref:Uncharacterized protein n=1 Tax=Sesamum alatum TaxID=300844 RepID=A0AAE2D0R6_9LAMI|nr:hypothetical protein Salat_0495500 [Sesamum alatum]